MADNTTNPHGTQPKSAEAATEAGRDLRDNVTAEARNMRDSAAAEVQARAEGAKDTLAKEVSSVGNALRKASEELRSGSPQEQAFATAASSLADMADSIQGQDMGTLLSNASAFAKRNPIAFLGGAALLGFAGARLAKASRHTTAGSAGAPYGGGQTAGGYGTATGSAGMAAGTSGGVSSAGTGGTPGGSAYGTTTGGTAPGGTRGSGATGSTGSASTVTPSQMADQTKKGY
jgi:uncharacterized protein YjbJ (UPF0337 family)